MAEQASTNMLDGSNRCVPVESDQREVKGFAGRNLRPIHGSCWTKASISNTSYQKGLRNKTLDDQNYFLTHRLSWCGPRLPTRTVSTNAAGTVAEVVVDRRSRQRVKHRSNQEVRAEEVIFFFPRIPLNPHTSYNDSHRVQLQNKRQSVEFFFFLKGRQIAPCRGDLHRIWKRRSKGGVGVVCLICKDLYNCVIFSSNCSEKLLR